MNEREREALIEAAAGSFRSREPFGAIRFHPAWHDLDPAGRVEAAETAYRQRRLEALLDEEELSSTARAVLRRIREPG